MHLSKYENIRIADMRLLTQTILDLYGFDFSNYAMSSLNRRVIRILDLYKLGTVERLVEKLKAEKEFFEVFMQEVTVNTTEMFRDPEMWRFLKEKVLPDLSKRSTIRVWHAACSTGEEVYSMGILLQEEDLLDRARLFASDLDREALAAAKKGHYSLRKIQLNEENYEKFEGCKRLAHYFSVQPDGRNVKMDASLMRNTYYMVHDLVQGSAFGKFDLVLVRNVLIYFNKQLQNQVLGLIHENMALGGYLVLGSKETMRWNDHASKFRVINLEERVYQKISD